MKLLNVIMTVLGPLSARASNALAENPPGIFWRQPLGSRENATAYGFKHTANEDACGTPAGEHLATRANKLLAEHVIRQVNSTLLR